MIDDSLKRVRPDSAYRRTTEWLESRAPSLLSLLDLPERRRRAARLRHRVRGRPRLKTIVTPRRLPTRTDVEIAARLLAAYGDATEDASHLSPAKRPDMWTSLQARQEQYASLLARGEAVELAAYLCNAPGHDVYRGIGQGDLALRRIMRDRRFRNWTALVIHDRLASLAEAVGAVAAETPDDPGFRRETLVSPNFLAEAIAGRLGMDVSPPDVHGSHFKLVTRAGRFAKSDPLAIFTAQIVRDTLANHPTPNPQSPRICEIGAGSGRAAYWISRLGLDSYTIVDLPHINVVQGYYLLKALPADRIVLYGERGWETVDDRVRVLPSHAIERIGEAQFDLVLNQDSLTEMHPDTVDDYLRWIARTCCGGLLLSVNHESGAPYGRDPDSGALLTHARLSEALERIGGYERRERYPYWLRRGFVAEAYRVLGDRQQQRDQ